MQTQQRGWKLFQQYHVATFVVRICIVATTLGPGLIGPMQLENVERIHAQHATRCSETNHTPIVVGDHILKAIGARYAVRWHEAAYKHNVASSSIHNQTICTPGSLANSASLTSSSGETSPIALDIPALPFGPATSVAPTHTQHAIAVVPARSRAPAQRQGSVAPTLASLAALLITARTSGDGNFFPYGQCTWWANQRYHQLHGLFVPWTTNANAGQWNERASQFGWRVSNTPTVGSIIVLQPGVQGAYGLGHVGVVEQVLANSSVIVSQMNWGAHAGWITETQFQPGPGVIFIGE